MVKIEIRTLRNDSFVTKAKEFDENNPNHFRHLEEFCLRAFHVPVVPFVPGIVVLRGHPSAAPIYSLLDIPNIGGERGVVTLYIQFNGYIEGLFVLDEVVYSVFFRASQSDVEKIGACKASIHGLKSCSDIALVTGNGEYISFDHPSVLNSQVLLENSVTYLRAMVTFGSETKAIRWNPANRASEFVQVVFSTFSFPRNQLPLLRQRLVLSDLDEFRALADIEQVSYNARVLLSFDGLIPIYIVVNPQQSILHFVDELADWDEAAASIRDKAVCTGPRIKIINRNQDNRVVKEFECLNPFDSVFCESVVDQVNVSLNGLVKTVSVDGRSHDAICQSVLSTFGLSHVHHSAVVESSSLFALDDYSSAVEDGELFLSLIDLFPLYLRDGSGSSSGTSSGGDELLTWQSDGQLYVLDSTVDKPWSQHLQDILGVLGVDLQRVMKSDNWIDEVSIVVVTNENEVKLGVDSVEDSIHPWDNLILRFPAQWRPGVHRFSLNVTFHDRTELVQWDEASHEAVCAAVIETFCLHHPELSAINIVVNNGHCTDPVLDFDAVVREGHLDLLALGFVFVFAVSPARFRQAGIAEHGRYDELYVEVDSTEPEDWVKGLVMKVGGPHHLITRANCGSAVRLTAYSDVCREGRAIVVTEESFFSEVSAWDTVMVELSDELARLASSEYHEGRRNLIVKDEAVKSAPIPAISAASVPVSVPVSVPAPAPAQAPAIVRTHVNVTIDSRTERVPTGPSFADNVIAAFHLHHPELLPENILTDPSLGESLGPGPLDKDVDHLSLTLMGFITVFPVSTQQLQARGWGEGGSGGPKDYQGLYVESDTVEEEDWIKAMVRIVHGPTTGVSVLSEPGWRRYVTLTAYSEACPGGRELLCRDDVELWDTVVVEVRVPQFRVRIDLHGVVRVVEWDEPTVDDMVDAVLTTFNLPARSFSAADVFDLSDDSFASVNLERIKENGRISIGVLERVGIYLRSSGSSDSGSGNGSGGGAGRGSGSGWDSSSSRVITVLDQSTDWIHFLRHVCEQPEWMTEDNWNQYIRVKAKKLDGSLKEIESITGFDWWDEVTIDKSLLEK